MENTPPRTPPERDGGGGHSAPESPEKVRRRPPNYHHHHHQQQHSPLPASLRNAFTHMLNEADDPRTPISRHDDESFDGIMSVGRTGGGNRRFDDMSQTPQKRRYPPAAESAGQNHRRAMSWGSSPRVESEQKKRQGGNVSTDRSFLSNEMSTGKSHHHHHQQHGKMLRAPNINPFSPHRGLNAPTVTATSKASPLPAHHQPAGILRAIVQYEQLYPEEAAARVAASDTRGEWQSASKSATPSKQMKSTSDLGGRAHSGTPPPFSGDPSMLSEVSTSPHRFASKLETDEGTPGKRPMGAAVATRSSHGGTPSISNEDDHDGSESLTPLEAPTDAPFRDRPPLFPQSGTGARSTVTANLFAEPGDQGPAGQARVEFSIPAEGHTRGGHIRTPQRGSSTGGLFSTQGSSGEPYSDDASAYDSQHQHHNSSYGSYLGEESSDEGEESGSRTGGVEPRHQFYHPIPWAASDDGEDELAPCGNRCLVPLHEDVNGTVWLATSMLDGLPYAVKEVDFNPALDDDTKPTMLLMGPKRRPQSPVDVTARFGDRVPSSIDDEMAAYQALWCPGLIRVCRFLPANRRRASLTPDFPNDMERCRPVCNMGKRYGVRYFNTYRDVQRRVNVIQVQFYPLGNIVDFFINLACRRPPPLAARQQAMSSLKRAVPTAEVLGIALTIPKESILSTILLHTTMAAASLHHHGVVHCNMHPRNVFVADCADDSFGAATMVTTLDDLLESTTLGGTDWWRRSGLHCAASFLGRFVLGQMGGCKRIATPMNEADLHAMDITTTSLHSHLESLVASLNGQPVGSTAIAAAMETFAPSHAPQHYFDAAVGFASVPPTLQAISEAFCWRDLATFAAGLIHLVGLCLRQRELTVKLSPEDGAGGGEEEEEEGTDMDNGHVDDNVPLVSLRETPELFNRPFTLQDLERTGLYSQDFIDTLGFMMNADVRPQALQVIARLQRYYATMKGGPLLTSESLLTGTLSSNDATPEATPAAATMLLDSSEFATSCSTNALFHSVVDVYRARIAELQEKISTLKQAPMMLPAGGSFMVEPQGTDAGEDNDAEVVGPMTKFSRSASAVPATSPLATQPTGAEEEELRHFPRMPHSASGGHGESPYSSSPPQFPNALMTARQSSAQSTGMRAASDAPAWTNTERRRGSEEIADVVASRRTPVAGQSHHRSGTSEGAAFLPRPDTGSSSQSQVVSQTSGDRPTTGADGTSPLQPGPSTNRRASAAARLGATPVYTLGKSLARMGNTIAPLRLMSSHSFSNVDLAGSVQLPSPTAQHASHPHTPKCRDDATKRAVSPFQRAVSAMSFGGGTAPLPLFAPPGVERAMMRTPQEAIGRASTHGGDESGRFESKSTTRSDAPSPNALAGSMTVASPLALTVNSLLRQSSGMVRAPSMRATKPSSSMLAATAAITSSAHMFEASVTGRSSAIGFATSFRPGTDLTSPVGDRPKSRQSFAQELLAQTASATVNPRAPAPQQHQQDLWGSRGPANMSTRKNLTSPEFSLFSPTMRPTDPPSAIKSVMSSSEVHELKASFTSFEGTTPLRSVTAANRSGRGVVDDEPAAPPSALQSTPSDQMSPGGAISPSYYTADRSDDGKARHPKNPHDDDRLGATLTSASVTLTSAAGTLNTTLASAGETLTSTTFQSFGSAEPPASQGSGNQQPTSLRQIQPHVHPPPLVGTAEMYSRPRRTVRSLLTFNADEAAAVLRGVHGVQQRQTPKTASWS